MSTQEAFIFTNTCFSNVGEFVAHICSSLEISLEKINVKIPKGLSKMINPGKLAI
jgi:hypothetical protein